MGQQLESEETDFFGADFACGNGSQDWQPTTIKFSNLQQGGWGINRPLELSDVSKIQFQTIGQPIVSFQCDIAAVVLSL